MKEYIEQICATVQGWKEGCLSYVDCLQSASDYAGL